MIVEHQQLLNASKHLMESSFRRLLEEENKEKQNDDLVLKLKEDIRQDIRLVAWIRWTNSFRYKGFDRELKKESGAE